MGSVAVLDVAALEDLFAGGALVEDVACLEAIALSCLLCWVSGIMETSGLPFGRRAMLVDIDFLGLSGLGDL